MLRPDFFIFGYRVLSVEAESTARISSLFLRHGISFVVKSKGDIFIKERDLFKIEEIISGRFKCSISPPMGVYGKWKEIKHKTAVCVGMLISLLFLFLSSQVVWDIRTGGNEKIADAEIMHRLSVSGFSVGDFWKSKELSEIENAFLSDYNDVAWININRRGSVAYVTLIEKDNLQQDVEAEILYSNILATRDAVVEEMVVVSGRGVVKPGDTVKAGDPLILGAMSDTAGGIFCRAEGNIKGRVSDTVSITVNRTYEKRRVVGKKLSSVRVNIFKFLINIFKTYGNSTNNCDIIEDENEHSLPGGARLPISIVLEYTPIYESEVVELTDEEMVAIASDRLRLATIIKLADSDLLRVSTRGEFTDDGYTMSNDLVYIFDIGIERSFDISE